MGAFLNPIRSVLFVLFMAATVVPWALAVLLVSIFMRGDTVYWMFGKRKFAKVTLTA